MKFGFTTCPGWHQNCLQFGLALPHQSLSLSWNAKPSCLRAGTNVQKLNLHRRKCCLLSAKLIEEFWETHLRIVRTLSRLLGCHHILILIWSYFASYSGYLFRIILTLHLPWQRVKIPPKKVGLSPARPFWTKSRPWTPAGQNVPGIFSRVGFAWPEFRRTILSSLQCCSRHLRSSIGPQRASLSQMCCITSNPGIQDKTSYYWQLLSFPGVLFSTSLHSTHALIDWTSRIPLIKPSDLTV